MGTHTRFRINTPAVVAEEIDGEVVIVNLETGSYYSLRDASASLWRLLENGATVGDAARALVASNGADQDLVAGRIGAFIDELETEQLVVQSSEAVLPDGLPEVEPHNDLELRLDRYDEMQEMLLYDPIHDVDETGWPNRPEAVVAPPEGEFGRRHPEP